MKKIFLLTVITITSISSMNVAAANRVFHIQPSPEQVTKELFFRGVEATIVGATIAGVVGVVTGVELLENQIQKVHPQLPQEKQFNTHYENSQPHIQNYRKSHKVQNYKISKKAVNRYSHRNNKNKHYRKHHFSRQPRLHKGYYRHRSGHKPLYN